MIPQSRRNFVLDTVDELSKAGSAPQIGSALADAMDEFGFTALGINSLPPRGEHADPFVLTEMVPTGFRDFYIDERLYHVDHISRHARASRRPFRFDEAPFERSLAHAHQRFLQAIQTFGMGEGLIVPIGRHGALPACVWMAEKKPYLDDDSILAAQVIALFAASHASALSQLADLSMPDSQLTANERAALQWTAAGKTSWEISMISRLSERAVNKLIADAMTKLGAVTRVQAVVNAIRIGEITI